MTVGMEDSRAETLISLPLSGSMCRSANASRTAIATESCPRSSHSSGSCSPTSSSGAPRPPFPVPAQGRRLYRRARIIVSGRDGVATRKQRIKFHHDGMAVDTRNDPSTEKVGECVMALEVTCDEHGTCKVDAAQIFYQLSDLTCGAPTPQTAAELRRVSAVPTPPGLLAPRPILDRRHHRHRGRFTRWRSSLPFSLQWQCCPMRHIAQRNTAVLSLT